MKKTTSGQINDEDEDGGLYFNNFPLDSNLSCLSSAFHTVMGKYGKTLNVDLKNFFTHLYAILATKFPSNPTNHGVCVLLLIRTLKLVLFNKNMVGFPFINEKRGKNERVKERSIELTLRIDWSDQSDSIHEKISNTLSLPSSSCCFCHSPSFTSTHASTFFFSLSSSLSLHLFFVSYLFQMGRLTVSNRDFQLHNN